MSSDVESNREFRPMRILVTGAAGKIARVVAARLAIDGHDLTLTDVRERPDGLTADVPALPAIPEAARWATLDLRDEAALRSLTRGIETIVHLGEIPGVPRVKEGEDLATVERATRETNIAICRSVLAAAEANAVGRVIYTSSCQRYGIWGGRTWPTAVRIDRFPLDESQPADPQNGYAESKAINEEQCRAYAERTGRVTFAFRFPAVCGVPGWGPEKIARYWHEADTLPREFGSYVFAQDVAEAYALAIRPDRPLEVPTAPFVALHFFADEVAGDLAIRDKLALAHRHWPPLPADWPERAPPATCERARRLLGWRPTRRLEQPAGLNFSGRPDTDQGQTVAKATAGSEQNVR